jgi:hypothetical protein
LAAIVALHPGTVDTPLSQPFQSFVPPGQLTTRQQAAQRLLDVLGGAGPADSGKMIGYDGKEIPA